MYPKCGGNHLLLASTARSTFSDFHNKWLAPETLCQLSATAAVTSRGVVHYPFREISTVGVVHLTALVFSWAREKAGLHVEHLGALGGGEKVIEWVPPCHSRVQARSQASPAGCVAPMDLKLSSCRTSHLRLLAQLVPQL